MKSIDIAGVGTVDFPEDMSDEDISKAIENEILPSVKAQADEWKRIDDYWSGRDEDGGGEPGYLSNLARGVGERALDLAGGGLRTVGRLAEEGGDWLERRIPLGTIGSPGTPMTEEQIRQDTVPLPEWGDKLAKVDLGYTPGTTFEDVKENLWKIPQFAFEQGVVSAPDMAAVMLAPAPYLAARTGEIAQTRAENDGRESATVDDLMRSAPSAAASALLERYSTRALAGMGDEAVTSFNQLPGAMGRAAVREGSTEAAQETSDYLGETLGTQRGSSFAEGAERAIAGAIAGAPFGGGIRGVTGAVQVWAADRGVEPTQENLETAAAQGDTRAIEILRAAGLMSDEQLASLSPEAAERFAERYQTRRAAEEDPILAAQRTQAARDQVTLEGGDQLAYAQRINRERDQGGLRREDILKTYDTATQQVDAAIEAGQVDPKQREAAIRRRVVGLMPELETRPAADSRTVARARARIDQILSLPADQHTPRLATEFLELNEVVQRADRNRVIQLGESRVDGKMTAGSTQDPGLAQAVDLRGRPNMPAVVTEPTRPMTNEQVVQAQRAMQEPPTTSGAENLYVDPAGQASRFGEVVPEQTGLALPSPATASRLPLTPEQVAQARAEAARADQAAARNVPLSPVNLRAPEGRLPQTPTQVGEQREADEAMRLAADRMRPRAGADVRDVRAGGRPEGGIESQETIVLDEGRPVRITERRTERNSQGQARTIYKVHRYDPRTDQAQTDENGEVFEYEVDAAKLTTGRYARDPRQAQEFEGVPEFEDRGARAPVVGGYTTEDGKKVTPTAAGQRADELQKLPRQTYRITDPDPTVPGAEGPTSGVDPRQFPPDPDGDNDPWMQPGGPVPRASRPNQGAGPNKDMGSKGRRGEFRGDETGAEAAARRAEAVRRAKMREQSQRSQTQDEKTGEKTEWGKARSKYENKTDGYSSTAKGVDEDGWPLTDEDGFVLSDAGGPIRFEYKKDTQRGEETTVGVLTVLKAMRKQHPDAHLNPVAHPGPMRPTGAKSAEAYWTIQATQPKPQTKTGQEQSAEPETEAAPETPSSAPSVPATAPEPDPIPTPDFEPGFAKREIRDGSGRQPGRRGAERGMPFVSPDMNFQAWRERRDQDVRDLEEASAAEAPSPYAMRGRNVRDASGKEAARRGAERGAPFSQDRDGNVTSAFREVNAEQLVASLEKGLRDRQVKPTPKAVAKYYEVSEEAAANALATIAGRSNKVIRQVKPSKKELAAALKPKEGAQAPAPKGPRYRLTPQFDEDMSLLEFIMSKGGLAANGDLTAMDAHRKSHPRYGNLVRKAGGGGLTLDEARELAEGEGYIGSGDDYQSSDIQDLLDAIEEELRGTRVTVERSSGGSERDQMERRARELGIEVNPEWDDATLMVEIGEADAIANEDKPTEQAADNLREVVDAMLVELGIFPDSYQADFDIPFGDERAQSGQGAREVGAAPEGAPAATPERTGGEASDVRSGDRAPEARTGDAQEAGRTGRQTPAIEKTDQGDQYVLVGQASSRDGKKAAKAPQRRADEGLFAEDDAPDPRQIDLEEAIAAAKVDEKPTPEPSQSVERTSRLNAIADRYAAIGNDERAEWYRGKAGEAPGRYENLDGWERLVKLEEERAAGMHTVTQPAKRGPAAPKLIDNIDDNIRGADEESRLAENVAEGIKHVPDHIRKAATDKLNDLRRLRAERGYNGDDEPLPNMKPQIIKQIDSDTGTVEANYSRYVRFLGAFKLGRKQVKYKDGKTEPLYTAETVGRELRKLQESIAKPLPTEADLGQNLAKWSVFQLDNFINTYGERSEDGSAALAELRSRPGWGNRRPNDVIKERQKIVKQLKAKKKPANYAELEAQAADLEEDLARDPTWETSVRREFERRDGDLVNMTPRQIAAMMREAEAEERTRGDGLKTKKAKENSEELARSYQWQAERLENQIARATGTDTDVDADAEEAPAKGEQREVDGVIVVATGNPDKPWAGGRYVEKGANSGWQPDTSLGFGDTPEAAAEAVAARRDKLDAEQKTRAEASNRREMAVERAKRGETLSVADVKALTKFGNGRVATGDAEAFLRAMGLNNKETADALARSGAPDKSEGGAWIYDLGKVISSGQNMLGVGEGVRAIEINGRRYGINEHNQVRYATNFVPSVIGMRKDQTYLTFNEDARDGDYGFLGDGPRENPAGLRVVKFNEGLWTAFYDGNRKTGSYTIGDPQSIAETLDKLAQDATKRPSKAPPAGKTTAPKADAKPKTKKPPKRKERAALLSRLFGRDPKTELTAEMEAADDAAWQERLEQIAPRAETVADIRRILDENVERGILSKGTAKGISDILGRIPTNGLKGVRLIIQDRMTAEERDILGTHKGALGEYVTFDDDPDTRVMVIHGRQGAQAAVDTFVHENAHVLFDRISQEDKAAARRIYDSLPISRQAMHTVDYGQQERFEEWFAESMVDYYSNGAATGGPRGSLFHQLGGLAQRLFKRIVDTFSNEKALVDAFFSGLERSLGYAGPSDRASLDREVSVKGITRRERRGVSTLAVLSNPIGAVTGDWKAWRTGWQEFTRDWKETRQGVRPNRQNALASFGRSFFYSADGEYRAAIEKFNSPTLNLLADTFHAKAGSAQRLDPKLVAKLGMKLAGNATFDEAVTRKVGVELNQLSRILKPFEKDEAAMDRIVDLVQRPASRRSDPESVAASEIARMLKNLHTYMKDAGVDVGEVKAGYFPREIDVAKVIKDSAGFVDAATKAYRASGLSAAKAKEAADNWLTNVLYGGEGSPVRKSSGTTPSFVQSRVLTKEADRILQEFYQRDPKMILGSYVSRAAKRAEIARRFGDNWKNWGDIEKQIRAEDPAAAGMFDHLRSYAATAAGVQQHNVPGIIRSGASMVRTVTSLSLLEKSTFSSLAEAIMPALRTGNLKDLLPAMTKTLNEFYRSWKELPPSLAAELAADIGAIAGSGVNSIMAARFAGGDPLGRGQARVLDSYFRRVLLTQWTDGTRVASTERGAVFLRRLARDIAGRGLNPKSARIYMAEMGIQPEIMDKFAAYVNGFGDDLPSPVDLDKGGEMGAAYRTALLRFVDTTVMRPGTTTRPRWASHPIGAVLFQLQAFSYAFSKNVLLRDARMAKTAWDNKEDMHIHERLRMAAPFLFLLPALAMVQFLVGELRDWLFMDPEKRAAQTITAKWEKAISRAGVTGALDPYLQMISGARYSRDPISTLSGPFLGVFGQGLGAMTQWIGNDSPNTNAAERKATEALYDVLFEPGINMLLGYAPVSPLTTVITTGLLPALRDDIVNGIAGERVGHKQQPIYGVSEIVRGKQFAAPADSWAARG